MDLCSDRTVSIRIIYTETNIFSSTFVITHTHLTISHTQAHTMHDIIMHTLLLYFTSLQKKLWKSQFILIILCTLHYQWDSSKIHGI